MKIYRKQRNTLLVGLVVGIIGSVLIWFHGGCGEMHPAKAAWLMVNSTAVAMGGVYVAWMLYLMRVGISVMFHYGLTARNFLITSVLFGGTFACVWFNHFIWGGILELLAVLMALITASIEFEE